MKNKYSIALLLCCLLFGCNSQSGNAHTSNERLEDPQAFGQFYDLETAYNKKMISKEDLAKICFYNNHGIMYDDDGNEINTYNDSFGSIGVLEKSLEQKMINDYTNLIKSDERFSEIDFTKENVVEVSVYCGNYNGFYAIRFSDILSLAAEEHLKKIDDFNFLYPYKYGEEVNLWKIVED